MARFSNGTEFGYWYSDNCNTCIHAGEAGSCEIMAVHMAHSGCQSEIQEILDTLIPVDEQGNNKRCPLFYDPNEVPTPKEQIAFSLGGN